MRRKFSRYLVLLGLVATLAVVAAACGGGGEEPAAAPPPAEPATPPAETGAPAETGEPAEAGATVGGPGVEEVQTSAGSVYADPAQNDPAVMKSVIEAEDWAFPVQFTDCTASDTDPNGCTPGTEVPGVYTPL